MSQQKTEEKKEEKKSGKFLAAVLIRGLIGLDPKIKDTLKMLNLTRKMSCVVLVDNASNRGMLKKTKDYLAWGEISAEVLKKIEPRKHKDNYYRLHPPRGGFERKGIKTPFTVGGALGYRGVEMDKLLVKML